MKKIFTLAMTMALTLSLYAYPPQSKLTISSNLKNSLIIVVDGKNVNTNNRTGQDIVINNLTTGYHSIKMYQRSNRGYGLNNNSSQQIVYNGNVYVKSQYHLDITINRFGKAFIDERPINSADYTEDYYENGNNSNSDWGNNTREQMNSISFLQLKQGIAKIAFDDSKQSYAKQAISANYLSAAQVKELLQLFNFETSKLEIAKFSYAYTIDKNNYFIMNDAFNYSSSREELTKFVQQHR